MMNSVSVVIPAKNEEVSITDVVTGVRTACPGAEIVVVDDGSTDATGARAAAAGATVLRHPQSRGNGAAIKSGARAARGEILVFMDADGQHDPAHIPQLLQELEQGYDLAIGARGARSQASVARWFGNGLYNLLASWMVGHRVLDLTSGFRAVRARLFRDFMHLLPNGFSYPTTSTMAFYRAGHGVTFVPVPVGRREGRSHIRLFRDGARFLVIIFRVGTLYSPLKIFLPCSLLFLLPGLAYSSYTLLALHRFTNFGALLLITAIIVFLMGLLSEQITTLMYLGLRAAARDSDR